MKNSLYFLLFCLSFYSFANYDPIINIPNANFKAKLLQANSGNPIASTETPVYNSTSNTWAVTTYNKIDVNNDGEIQLSEALNIKWLKINNSGIASLTGIEAFTNLQSLNCFANQIPSLNVSSISNLKYLNCSDNLLSNINVSGLINLQYLSCYQNLLNNLDISGLVNLRELKCYFNQLQSLNVSGLSSLQLLSCGFNQLANLDVSSLNILRQLHCEFNQLTNIDVSGFYLLQGLNCNNNQLTNLNVSGCSYLQGLSFSNNNISSVDISTLTNLISLECSNNQIQSLNVSSFHNLYALECANNQLLTSLIIKNGQSNIESYNFGGNFNLEYICCSDNQLAQVLEKVLIYEYNCPVNTYCSFNPGGYFNTVSGKVQYDFNNNGCDISDFYLSHALLEFSDGNNTSFVSTNNQGQYNAYVGSGTHSITPQIENPSLFNITPLTANINFPNNNNNQTQNFCITSNGEQLDVEVIFIPLNPASAGFDADYKIVYRNIGNQVANGEVYLTYMSDRIDLVSSSVAPTTQTSEQLIWNYQNLMPFETRTINLRFNINSPMETPPVNNGDLLSYGTYITPLDGDINAFNNTSALRQEVVGSYDPNDKTCLQGNTPAPTVIGQYVHYLIRFENTGTFFAQNVVIRDDIDLAKFDINSLVVLDTSHDMLVTRINGNRVEFIFEGIQLPFPPSEERHGYVLFKIKTKSNLTVGSTFSNQAGIYFDYNWPIITNDEVSTITLLGQPNFEFSELISLYPNPANDVINLSAKAGVNLKSVEIYNTLGQLVMAVPNSMNQLEINVSHLHSGSYFVKVHTDRGVGHTKFVKAP